MFLFLLCVASLGCSSVHVCVVISSYKDTSQSQIRAHHLTSFYLNHLFFQIQSYFELLVVGLQHVNLGEATDQTITLDTLRVSQMMGQHILVRGIAATHSSHYLGAGVPYIQIRRSHTFFTA